MNIKLKYIMYDDETFVIFPVNFSHSDMVDRYKKVSSAGFAYLIPHQEEKKLSTVLTYKARCFGESVSLKVKSKEADSQIMEREFSTYIRNYQCFSRNARTWASRY